MKKSKKIIIDLEIWATQQDYAEEKGVSLNNIAAMIRRRKAGIKNGIQYWVIPELNNLTLIKRGTY